jgi:hypothetical protein
MALMNQKPKKTTAVTKKANTVTKKNEPNPYKGLKDAWGNEVGGPGNVPPFDVKKKTTVKKTKK